MKLTLEQTKHLLEGNNDFEAWHQVMSVLLPKYEIDTADRIAGFIAQCGHESLNFRVLEENLNYSAKGLDAVFPKYFKKAGRNSAVYHRDPVAIANVVYANRMGNGDTHSGDGWKFRGRGVVQLTGKNNVGRFGDSIGKDIDETIDHLSTKYGALESACWFWNSRNLNAVADDQDVLKMTRMVNGGTNGLEDRKHHYKRALAILGGDYTPKPSPILLKVGSTGENVKKVQKKLSLDADGIFGLVTKQSVEAWQTENGLVADGIVGPKTFKAMVG